MDEKWVEANICKSLEELYYDGEDIVKHNNHWGIYRSTEPFFIPKLIQVIKLEDGYLLTSNRIEASIKVFFENMLAYLNACFKDALDNKSDCMLLDLHKDSAAYPVFKEELSDKGYKINREVFDETGNIIRFAYFEEKCYLSEDQVVSDLIDNLFQTNGDSIILFKDEYYAYTETKPIFNPINIKIVEASNGYLITSNRIKCSAELIINEILNYLREELRQALGDKTSRLILQIPKTHMAYFLFKQELFNHGYKITREVFNETGDIIEYVYFERT